MILDIALVVIALIAVATGYNKGALATLLSILGYFGGGVAGFALANLYSAEWKGSYCNHLSPSLCHICRSKFRSIGSRKEWDRNT